VVRAGNQWPKCWRDYMLAFEIVGMALFTLFFGAFFTNKPIVRR
jgi:hypothetical protein